MSMFYVFLSNTSYFSIVDYIYDFKGTHGPGQEEEKNNTVRQWFNRFLYNFTQHIITILFNNEKQIMISNLRQFGPETEIIDDSKKAKQPRRLNAGQLYYTLHDI